MNDIYEDLEHFDFSEELQKLKFENVKLVERIEKLEKENVSIAKKCTQFEAMFNTVHENISSLLKTSKAEIERKDKAIADLRKQVDDMVFRRQNRPQISSNQNYQKPVNNIQETRSELRPLEKDSESSRKNIDTGNLMQQLSDRNIGDKSSSSSSIPTQNRKMLNPFSSESVEQRRMHLTQLEFEKDYMEENNAITSPKTEGRESFQQFPSSRFSRQHTSPHGRKFDERENQKNSIGVQQGYKRSRSPHRRSTENIRSRSPVRKHSRSPYRKLSKSPRRKRLRSPHRKRSKSPYRKHSNSPYRRQSRSPHRKHSNSPYRRQSRSPHRKSSRSSHRTNKESRSPLRKHSRSSFKDNSKSPNRKRASPIVYCKNDLKSPNRKKTSPTRNYPLIDDCKKSDLQLPAQEKFHNKTTNNEDHKTIEQEVRRQSNSLPCRKPKDSHHEDIKFLENINLRNRSIMDEQNNKNPIEFHSESATSTNDCNIRKNPSSLYDEVSNNKSQKCEDFEEGEINSDYDETMSEQSYEKKHSITTADKSVNNLETSGTKVILRKKKAKIEFSFSDDSTIKQEDDSSITILPDNLVDKKPSNEENKVYVKKKKVKLEISCPDDFAIKEENDSFMTNLPEILADKNPSNVENNVCVTKEKSELEFLGLADSAIKEENDSSVTSLPDNLVDKNPSNEENKVYVKKKKPKLEFSCPDDFAIKEENDFSITNLSDNLVDKKQSNGENETCVQKKKAVQELSLSDNTINTAENTSSITSMPDISVDKKQSNEGKKVYIKKKRTKLEFSFSDDSNNKG